MSLSDVNAYPEDTSDLRSGGAQGSPSELITDPAFVRGVRLLAEWDLSFDLCVTHDQLPAVGALVRSCPRTTFVLDHLGKPPVASGRLDPWRAHAARIASFPNVACKLSGLATEAAPGWDPADRVRRARTRYG